MAQFTLGWNNSDVVSNANNTTQIVSYRRKSVGGAFITAGFTPENNLAKSVSSADSPVLLDNVIYEFTIQALCTSNGPALNDNGVQEMIGFGCITPTITKTDTTAIVTVSCTDLDITKATFTVKKSSDNTIIKGPITFTKVANDIVYSMGGLLTGTAYYVLIELYATINNTEVISSSIGFVGTTCGSYAFTTNAPAICNPVTAMVVTSIETL